MPLSEAIMGQLGAFLLKAVETTDTEQRIHAVEKTVYGNRQ